MKHLGSSEGLSTTGHRKSGWPQALSWSALTLFALLVIASLWLAGPQVEADEGSYLVTAARLAGRLHDTNALGYYSGYSLFLVPAFLIARSATSIYHVAVVINALLVATTPFALFRLTRLLFADIEARRHIAAAVIATCYSSLLIISQYTMSESALVPLYAWMTAAGAATVFGGRALGGVSAGALAGLLFLVHPRGAAIAAPALAMLLVGAIVRRELRVSVALVWIAAIAIASLHAPIERLAGKNTTVAGSYSIARTLSRLGSGHAWDWFLLNLLGTVTEAIVTTLGVLLIAGAVIAATLVRTRVPWRSPRALVLLSLALGLCAAFLLSALFFIPPTRADQIAYGRYALPALIPMIAIGVLHFPSANRGYLRLMIGTFVIGGICLFLLAFAFNRIPQDLTSVWNFVNSPALFLASRLFHAGPALAGIALFFIMGVGLICGLGWIAGRSAAQASFLAVNVSLALFGSCAITIPFSRYYSHTRRIADTVLQFEKVTQTPLCITVSGNLDAWSSIDYRWRLFPQVDAQTGNDRHCVRGYVRPITESLLRQPGIRLVEVDPRSPIGVRKTGLFLTKGTALDTWATAQPLLSVDNFVVARPTERRARIAVHPPDEPVAVGSRIALAVSVTNESSNSIWGRARGGTYPIMLGARLDHQGQAAARQDIAEYRAEFSSDVLPGKTTEASLSIGPFEKPGTYRVIVGVLQEGVAWYAGTQQLDIEVISR